MNETTFSLLERRSSHPEEWLSGLCREFSNATGWLLRFIPEQTGDSSTPLALDLDWCWHSDITDGSERLGTMCLDIPGAGRHSTLTFESAWRLADLLAQQSSRILQYQRQARHQAQEIGALISHPGQIETNIRERLKSLLRAAAHLLQFRGAGLFVLDPDGRSLRLRMTHHFADSEIPSRQRTLTRATYDLQALEGRHVVVHRGADEAGLWLPDDISTATCTAVTSDAGPVGTLWLYDRRSREIAENEQRMLRGFARQMAELFERIVLIRDSEVRHRLARELDVIASATAGCSEFRDGFPGFEVAVRCRSRMEVGGDLCDVFPFDEHRTFFVLGDGSGDGIPAAMVMTAARSALHALIEASGTEPPGTDAIMSVVNRALLRVTASQQFLSAITGMIDARDNSLVFTNAGHPPGLHLRGNQVHPLDPQGMLLGVIDVATYGRSRIELQSGDLLILFSDGITEARNRTQQMFRQQGVLEAVQGLTSGTAGDVLDRIWSRYESHTGGENNDDRTLMVIRVR